MAAKFPFDRDFQIGILGLMTQNHSFLITSVDLFEASYFEDTILVWFFQTMKDHYLNYGEQPSVDPIIANELKKSASGGRIKATEISDYAAVCKRLLNPVIAQSYVIDEVIRFCRRQAGRKAYLETAQLMDTATDEDWDGILERISDISNIGSNFHDLGTNFFKDAPERLRKRQQGDHRKISPTGIGDLDIDLGGGLKDGQLGIWMGGTGGGKSIALPHVGRRAVSAGWNVAHYTLELNEDDVAERYDACWTSTPVHELNSHRMLVARKLKKLEQSGIGTASGGFADRLMIKHYPTGTASINTIKGHLKQLSANHWYPDVLIVDYGDLLRPLTNYDNEYSDLGAIFKDLRGLAGEYNVPLWTATQVNRGGLSQDIVDIEHIGDSLKKAQIADVIIAICATHEQKRENKLTLFGAKNRNGRDKFKLEIPSDYSRMLFFDIERYATWTGQVQQAATQQAGQPPPTQPVKARRRPKTNTAKP